MERDPICGMEVNEKGGLRLIHGGKSYYFCGTRCVEKFAKKSGISKAQLAACQVTLRVPFYRNKTLIVASTLLALVFLSYTIPVLVPFRRTLVIYFKTLWTVSAIGRYQ